MTDTTPNPTVLRSTRADRAIELNLLGITVKEEKSEMGAIIEKKLIETMAQWKKDGLAIEEFVSIFISTSTIEQVRCVSSIVVPNSATAVELQQAYDQSQVTEFCVCPKGHTGRQIGSRAQTYISYRNFESTDSGGIRDITS